MKRRCWEGMVSPHSCSLTAQPRGCPSSEETGRAWICLLYPPSLFSVLPPPPPPWPSAHPDFAGEGLSSPSIINFYWPLCQGVRVRSDTIFAFGEYSFWLRDRSTCQSREGDAWCSRQSPEQVSWPGAGREEPTEAEARSSIVHGPRVAIWQRLWFCPTCYAGPPPLDGIARTHATTFPALIRLIPKLLGANLNQTLPHLLSVKPPSPRRLGHPKCLAFSYLFFWSSSSLGFSRMGYGEQRQVLH